MATLMYRTAGESHGPALIGLVEGMPHGCPVDPELINRELLRRQGGYGRGGRMKIETDKVQFLAGVRMGKTIGSPIALMIPNKDNRLDDPAATRRWFVTADDTGDDTTHEGDRHQRENHRHTHGAVQGRR